MAEERNGATHSLRTEIQMLFETDGVEKVAGDIDKISEKVDKLTEPVKALTMAFEELNDSPLKDLVKKLDNFSVDSVKVGAANLRAVLEKKIAQAIVKSKIEFIGEDNPERYPFKVPLGDKFWDKNRQPLLNAIAKALNELTIEPGDIPPLDTKEIMEEFQKKFNEQIVDLIKEEQVFSLYATDKHGKKKPKYQRKFKLDEGSVDQIMTAIEQRFVQYLSDPENIVLGDIPKFEIDSSKLKQVVLKIQDSIGSIDKLLGIDPDALKDLPNIEQKLVRFRENLDQMIREINNLAIQLDSITFGKATEAEVKQAIESISGLKDKVSVQIKKWIYDYATLVESNLNLRPNLDTFKESIISLNKYFDSVFQQQLDLLKEDVNKVVANIEARGGDRKDLLQGKKIDITQTILDVITENLLKKDIPIELDKSAVENVIQEWAGRFNTSLTEELTPLLDKGVEGFSNLLETISNKIDIVLSEVEVDLLELIDREGSSVFNAEDIRKIFNSIQSNIYNYVLNVLKNVAVVNEDTGKISLSLPKSFNRDIKRIIEDSIREYTQLVLADFKASAVDNAMTGEFVQRLNKHTTMLVNAVIRKVNQILTDIRSEFLHLDEELAQSTVNLKITIQNRVKSLVDSINNALESLLVLKDVGNLSQISIDMVEFTGRIDAVVKEAILQRLNQLQFSTLEDATIMIDLSKPLQEALKVIEKVISEITNNAISKISTEDLVEGLQLNIKTGRLQNNINRLIQKIINEKSKQITAYGNELVASLGFDETSLANLKKSIDNIVASAVVGISEAADRTADKVFSEEEVSKIYQKMLNGLTESFTVFTDGILKGLNDIGTGQFKVATSTLHPRIKRAFADYFNISVKELTKAMPEVTGKEVQQMLLQKNVQLIVDALNNIISRNIRKVISSYEYVVKRIDVKPDRSLVEYIYDQLIRLQDTIISKAKDMVRKQFRFLTEEIRRMNIDARSMGYRPTKAFVKEISRASGAEVIGDKSSQGVDVNIENVTLKGANVVAEGLKIDSSSIELPSVDKLVTNASSVIVDGKLVDLKAENLPVNRILIPIKNLLESEYPFSVDPAKTPHLSSFLSPLYQGIFEKDNVLKRGYDSLNLEQFLISQKVGTTRGGFEGIISNMAKYFVAGYLMRLPIKALTDASSVARELDYHIAKAGQNILIKDPDMTSTARRIVYERYQAEGRDVRSREFSEDVEREAANLRNMMKTEMPNYLLNISKAYYQEIADVGRYYSIASRRARDPYEALLKTREIAKIAAVEEDIDTDFAATGIDALAAQWHIADEDLGRYINMLLKTAMLSNTTVTDLLMAQRDTAAMFRSRMSGVDNERAFASAMALSSMFVEATGKSGREAGTFWRNVLQRPYTNESREFLESLSQIRGFENLSPYYINEAGEKVQKDFVTMFSNILEATLKTDDPSAMTILSEIFPMRTIGGAESISSLVQDLKTDLERSIEILKDMGELDEDATIDTVNIKEVIDKYIENIMEVTDKDIGMYLAGLQDTSEFAIQGMRTQWQSTVYNIFRELKEEVSAAMTYLTAILRKFEENSDKMAEVIGIFFKIGVGYLGKRALNKIVSLGEQTAPVLTDVQREMAQKYVNLQTLEKSLDLKRSVLSSSLEEYSTRLNNTTYALKDLEEKRQEIQAYIEGIEGKKILSADDKYELSRAIAQRNIYDDQIIKLRNVANQLETKVGKLSQNLNEIQDAYSGTLSLGDFLYKSMGARNVAELKQSFANYIRNNDLYTVIAPLVLRSQLGFSDDKYAQLMARKAELEGVMLSQQKEMLDRFTSIYGAEAETKFKEMVGEDVKLPFFAMRNRLSEETIKAMKLLGSQMEFDREYAKMRKNFERTHEELNAINSELIDMNIARLEVERAIFEAERPIFKGYKTIDGIKVPITEPKPTIQKIHEYRSLLPGFGVDIDSFESGMDRLADMFKDGKIDVDKYEDALREVATQLGITEQNFGKFKATVMDLNNQITSGKRAIYEYIAALETASASGNRVMTGNLAGRQTSNVTDQQPSSQNNNLRDVVALGALAGGGGRLLSNTGFGKIISAIGQKLGATKLGAVLSTGLGSILNRIGATKFGGVLGKALRGIGVGVKGIFGRVPQLAIMYALVSAGGNVLGGLTEKSMTDAERLSLEADKLEKEIRRAASWKINEGDNLLLRTGKQLGSIAFGAFGGLTNQLNRLFGGTAPSFMDTMRIRFAALREDPNLSRNELITRLKELYDVELKRAEAYYERQQEYLNKNPFINPVTGELRDEGDPYLMRMPLEDLIEFLDRKMKDLNNALTKSDALFTKEKVRLLTSGIAENSAEMRKAIKEHLDKNINEMRRLVDEFKQYLPTLVPGTETYTTMQMQILDLEKRISEAELTRYQTDFSEFDEIMERYSRSSTDIQTRYDIKKYDAILAGIKEDSYAIRQIEKKMVEEQVKMITGIQNRLDVLRQQFADKPEQRDRILTQIQQLEADKKRILADIKDKLNEGISTFNLPSEIQPISYYEAMTKDNTHRNVTVRAGDTIVNVNIDNMTGSDADIDRLGRVVADAVTQAQRNFVRQFANDVKSGMGRSYFSWSN